MIDRDLARALRFLAAGDADALPASGDGKLILDGGERGCVAVPATVLRALLRQGLASRRGTRLALTPEGAARRRREAAVPADAFQVQHRETEERLVDMPEGRRRAVVNLDESPLAALARRRDREGRPLLTGDEVAAGERLRADYTRGQIMPRLGANWQAAVASGRRDGATGGMPDLTDAALAARIRVEKALEAVGPELAGVLVDICCFLKGLEAVERERGWPARSARLLLRTALGALSRHYRPPAPRRARPAILHWGADDYRPTRMHGEAAP